jgi:hypothetical protein
MSANLCRLEVACAFRELPSRKADPRSSNCKGRSIAPLRLTVFRRDVTLTRGLALRGTARVGLHNHPPKLFCYTRARTLRRMNSITPNPIPSRATAEPPSGTVAAFAEKLKKIWLPPAFWDVKAHAPSVGSIPGCRCDIRKAQFSIYITPPHNLGGGIEMR